MDKKWKIRSEAWHKEQNGADLRKTTFWEVIAKDNKTRAYMAEADLVECLDMLEEYLSVLKTIERHGIFNMEMPIEKVQSLLNKHK